jgi:hypothetical protein
MISFYLHLLSHLLQVSTTDYVCAYFRYSNKKIITLVENYLQVWFSVDSMSKLVDCVILSELVDCVILSELVDCVILSEFSK